SFAQVATATDERYFELMLVDVIFFVGGGQDFALVNIVDADVFEDLRFDKMADTAFRHDGDRDGFHNFHDHARIAHAGHAALRANVGGDALQGHDRTCSGVLGDFCVFRRHHVHDYAALEHLRQAALQQYLIIGLVGYGQRAFAIAVTVRP